VPRFLVRIGRVPTKASEIWENLQGRARARQIVEDAICEPDGLFLGVGPELEGTHASSIGDETRPVF